MKQQISAGILHDLPADLKSLLSSNSDALTTWEDITPIARNEWICWIESARKEDTRTKRLNQCLQNLSDDKATLFL